MTDSGEYFVFAAVVAASYLPLLSRTIRASRWILFAVAVTISLHHAVSAYNYWIATLPGADLDAQTFHGKAASAAVVGGYARSFIGTDAYEYLLYLVYSVLGTSKFIGQSLSVFAAALICLSVLHIARRLDIRSERSLAALVLIAGLTPSFLFYTSLTFREPFQALGLAAGVAFFVAAAERKSKAMLAAMVAALLFMGFFHHILMALAFVLIATGLGYWFYVNRSSMRGYLLRMSAVTCVVAAVGWVVVMTIPASEGNDYVRILRETGGVVKMIDRYRSAVEHNLPRSTYGYEVDAGSFVGLAQGLVKSYSSYLFGPGLYSIRSEVDVVPFINAVGRMLAVGLLVLGLARRRIAGDYRLLYLATIYVVVTFTWSLGTTNYGQSFRHNAMTDWVLALVAVKALYSGALRRSRENGR